MQTRLVILRAYFSPIAIGLLLCLPACATSRPAAIGHAPVSSDYDCLVDAALKYEPSPIPRDTRRLLLRAMSSETGKVRSVMDAPRSEESLLESLNKWFFAPSGYAVERDSSLLANSSIVAVLTNRRGTCVGLTIVYLALAQQLGLDAHAVSTPVHLFIRVKLDDGIRNVELLEGGQSLDDDIYRRRYKIDDASIASGAFMAELTNDQVIAHLLSNQAVALSKQGKLDEALAGYDRALKLHPKLVVAWYNRGMDLMNAGRLKEALDSFNHAIELYPSDAQAHNNRGRTRERLGDPDGARADYERALQLDPGMKEADENLKRLLTPQ